LAKEDTLILLATKLLSRPEMVSHLRDGGSTIKQELSNLGEPDHTLCKCNQMVNQTTWLLQVPILNGGNSSSWKVM